MCSKEEMTTVNLRTIDWGIQWEQVTMVFYQLGLGRDIH